MRDGPARAPCADNRIGDDGARAVGDGVGRLAALTSLTLDLQCACVWEGAGARGRRAHACGGAGTRGGAGGGERAVWLCVLRRLSLDV